MVAFSSPKEGTPILGHTRDGRPEYVNFRGPKNLRMGINFCPKTCGWVITLIHKTSRLVIISIILPGNGWFLPAVI